MPAGTIDRPRSRKSNVSSASGALAAPAKMCYSFGRLKTEGKGDQKKLLGGKGANLAEMSSIGLPVPPGFTITTDVCAAYYANGERLPAGLMDEVRSCIALLEKETGKTFGSNENPLLVSVRSGAAVSMPGMMDTVLNLGLTDDALAGLIHATGNVRFAYDAYRRLINMFGDVVMGVHHDHFEEAFDRVKRKYGAKEDTDVPIEGMQQLCEAYKKVYRDHVGEPFPQDPYRQLELSIEAVFKSWNAPRAIAYRRINEISGLNGTAVNVQTMVFGNMGQDSGTGVAFTRNPSTGDNTFYGEFLINAQGEDVVAGIRTPQPVAEMPRWNKQVHKQLLEIKDILEKHYREMQDIEFTIERGTLYMLQTRTGKRTGAAAVKIAVDMVKEGLIDEKLALKRIPANDLTQLLLPSFSESDKKGATVLAKGLPASPGAATGKLAFTADEAVHRAKAGEKVILIRKETSPEDVDGMHHAAGILTSTGGMTSHAAVVARGWGKCCVVGAGALSIDAKARKVTIGKKTYGPKDVISIDGSTGEIMLGEVKRSTPKLSGDFATVMTWSDQYARLGVRTNADTPADARRAREFGAKGIGLTRTEHMFFEGDRIKAMREMIIAESRPAREKALRKLLPYQRKDFIGIFTAMNGLPVTVRLLDPPLHEFLPHEVKQQRAIARELGVPLKRVQQRISALHEMNPMLGHRGCRLTVTYPEILVMQVTAIVEAAIACKGKKIDAKPEIMIPLVGTRQELAMLRDLTLRTIDEVKANKKFTGDLPIPVGTMIEVPRAALVADQIAEVADFFSFGTNDLTQMTFGFSRDDINSFLPDYLQHGLLEKDPFQSLDQTGVGQLVEVACARGRNTKPTLKLGICGEHGGDPASIVFFHKAGLDYVSCSPFRVPIARLVAAQAAIG
ncbi:MAG: pyruvate, phosphate dikinase [Phycisphaeraceae bacterium]|nr:pyruvate, phosphate dikinase [Phycisphaerales bacterium]QOJ17844.1 MAG: pyruvate, phosphate dikinase [Phycisphaeraceae bacterium]